MRRNIGNPYTIKEKRAILKYIVDHEAYYRVKGDALWHEMERNFPSHTWQSLKQHFKKQLFPKLQSSDLALTADEIRKFRGGYQSHVANKKRRVEANRRSPTPDSFYKIWSSDDDEKSRPSHHSSTVSRGSNNTSSASLIDGKVCESANVKSIPSISNPCVLPSACVTDRDKCVNNNKKGLVKDSCYVRDSPDQGLSLKNDCTDKLRVNIPDDNESESKSSVAKRQNNVTELSDTVNVNSEVFRSLSAGDLSNEPLDVCILFDSDETYVDSDDYSAVKQE